MLEVRLLGQFDLKLDGAAVPLASRPAQALLAYLILNAGKAQRRERLAGVLWPEAAEDNARTYLRQALWRVRKAIGDTYLHADRMTVAFNSDAVYWLDAAVLAGQPAGATVDDLLAAAAVYEGDLLPGFYDDWVTLERERLAALYLRRMDALLDALAAQKRWDDVLLYGERWLASGSGAEPAYRALMMAHAALGDLSSMIVVYRRCVEMLRSELALAPSPETQSLFRRLSQGAAAGESGAADLGALPAAPPAFLAQAQPAVPAEEDIVGREAELGTLDELGQRARAGQGAAVFITGEAGRGKTALLREFVRRARTAHPDLIVTSGACPVFTPICAPYGLFREALQTLTGDMESAWAAGTISRRQVERQWQLLPGTIDLLLQHGPHLIGSLLAAPELSARAQAAGAAPAQIERLQALAARTPDDGFPPAEQNDLIRQYADFLVAFSGRQPVLLILDDLHWADPSSIGLLAHLGHRLAESAILLVAAYRPEDVDQGRGDGPHPLLPVLAEYKRYFGQVVIDLNESAADHGRAFVDSLLDREANAFAEPFRQALTRHTDGHPLFVVELLREMRQRGVMYRDETGRWVVGPDFDWGILPPRVEGVVEARISRLDPSLRPWLNLASVEGETFTAEVVARALGLEAYAVVNRLSQELDKQHHLVGAQGVRQAGGRRLAFYQFRHNLFRQYLYRDLDEIERSYLHQQVGEILEQLFEGHVNEIADRLAHHFQMAGVPEKTMRYLIMAGANSARLNAYDEARDYFEQALTLARQHGGDGRYDAELTQLYSNLGRALEHSAGAAAALAVYQEMEELGRRQAHQPMLLQALAAQATLYATPTPIHDPRQGQAIARQALALAQELGDQAAEIRILRDLMVASGYANRLEEAIDFGERSLALARQRQDRQQLAFTLNDLSGWQWVVGQIDRARDLLREAEEFWRQSGNLPMLADALLQASFANMFAGDYDAAIALSGECRQISQTIGNQWNLAFSRSRIGFVHRARGDLGLSIAVAEESLRLGVGEDLPNPQIFAGAELALNYAYLGAPDQGLAYGHAALQVAAERVPLFRPYVQAALAQNYLVQGDLPQAAAALRAAREDVYWQALPVLCIAPSLVEIQLALANGDSQQARQSGEVLLDTVRGFGARAFLPDLLSLLGRALLNLDRPAAARARFAEARQEAEAMAARGKLWPVLFQLSLLAAAPDEAMRLRRAAGTIIAQIAESTNSPQLRASFRELAAVRAVLDDQ